MPPAWWGLRYERDAPNACPLNSLALRKPRATSEAAPGAFERGATQPSPDALPLELQPGPCPGAAGDSRGDPGGIVSKSSPDRSSLVVVLAAAGAGGACAAASERADCAGPTRSAEPATSRDALERPGLADMGIRGRNGPRRRCAASLPRQCPGCTPSVTGSCRRTADSTFDPPRGRTRRLPGGPGSLADRPRSAACGRGVSVPGVARPRPTAAPPHLARCLKSPPARAARRSQRPPGTSTCKRNLWER